MPIKVTATQLKAIANGKRRTTGNGVVCTPISIAIEGAPGCGKTSVVRSIAEDWELPCITVAINQWSTSADIVGFKYSGKGTIGGGFDLESEDAMPAWLPVWRKDPTTGERVMTSDKTKGFPVSFDEKTKMAEPHPAVVLLDEFSAARSAVQGTFLTVTLDKIVKTFRLHPDTTFFIAFNGCNRDGFRGMNNDISKAMVGPNARFHCVELVYEAESVKQAILRNPNISEFWKAFTKKFIEKLNLTDDSVKTDNNVSGRTFESLLVELTNHGLNNQNWDSDPLAKLILQMHFEGSPSVLKNFMTFVKKVDVPTGEDYLAGKIKVNRFSDAITAIHEICGTLGFRKRSKQDVISIKENAFLQDFMEVKYPTGMMKSDGNPIMGSRKELYMVLKASILNNDLQDVREFRWVAEQIENFDSNTEDEDEI